MPVTIAQVISNTTSISLKRIEACLSLLEEGCTMPFIARYRKEATASLNEIEIQQIMQEKARLDEIEKRKKTILDEIESQGKLTADLKTTIENTFEKQKLEDIYLPYKPQRATRASKAIDAGLKPTADFIRSYKGDRKDIWKDRLNFTALSQKGFETEEAVLQGILDIIAAEAAENIRTRESVRKEIFFKGEIVSKVTKEHAETQSPFKDYYNKTLRIQYLKSHQTLALFRGETEKVLRLKLTYDADKVISWIEKGISYVHHSVFQEQFKKAAADCLKRLMGPSIEKEIRTTLKESADKDAISIFDNNLETLLMAPPAGNKAVLAIDPGFRTGCKVAILNSTGQYKTHCTIYPTEPKKDIRGSQKIILELIHTYKPAFIAIGNGTAGRETEQFIKEEVLPQTNSTIITLLVNEAGASVYSASDVAIKEFPDLDLTIRGAISIGRRLQDPLVELVKIDPKSIGVGQYQHDVNQKQLKESLGITVSRCVNSVGVNLNLASRSLLEHVSGLTTKSANEIVLHRNSNGAFKSRAELKKVKGIGPKAFEQCAGFLRISEGRNPLDNSAVHPESYDVVKKIAEQLSVSSNELLQNPELLKQVSPEDFTDEKRGIPTITDIFDEIMQPGRDPREEFTYASFDEAVNSIDDLHEDMVLEGVVTNVTAFGAFVDIGVHQDGLVHISQLANKFVSNPTDVVSTGQVVTVRVTQIEKERKRISLSMRDL